MIVTHCSSDIDVVDDVVDLILLIYLSVLLISTFSLSFITRHVPRPILKESIATKTAILAGTGPVIALLIAENLIEVNVLHYQALWWVIIINEVIITVGVLGLLFLYQVSECMCVCVCVCV